LPNKNAFITYTELCYNYYKAINDRKVKVMFSKRIIPIIFLTLILISFTSCLMTRFNVKISSLQHPTISEKRKVIILPLDQNISQNDLQFQEFSKYVKNALAANGFTVVNSFNEAEAVVFLFYGIGDPQQHIQTVTVPTWGQTGISSSTTSGTISSFGNTSIFKGTTTYEPEYGITGTQTITKSYVSYFRYAYLVAYDIHHFIQTEEMLQVWSTEISSTGSSGDLRRVFPVMIAAAAPYIGANTGKQIEVIIAEEDEKVIQIKER